MEGVTLGALVYQNTKCRWETLRYTFVQILLIASLFGIAFKLNTSSEHYKLEATYNDALSDGQRIEFRKLHDYTHGSWHIFTAVALFIMVLVPIEGLTGSLRKMRFHPEVSFMAKRLNCLLTAFGCLVPGLKLFAYCRVDCNCRRNTCHFSY